MKKNRSGIITGILSIAGVLLIVGAMSLTVCQSSGQKLTAESNREILKQLYTLMPTVHAGVQDDRVDMNMPMLEIDGENFIGILDIAMYGKKLPVGGSWNKHKVSAFPCRYDGNLYDGSLIIGGSDAAGQFDFMKSISIGDSVFLTDMMGGQYSYRVEWIEITSDVSAEYFSGISADLILFARNSFSLDYSVVKCTRQVSGHKVQ